MALNTFAETMILMYFWIYEQKKEIYFCEIFGTRRQQNIDEMLSTYASLYQY